MDHVLPRRWWSVALAVYWLGLTLGTHYPTVRVPDQFAYSDKVIHCGAFAGLTVLVCFAFGVRRRALVTLLLAGYAAIDESTQELVGRHADVLDWIADTLGILLGMAFVHVTSRRREPRA